MKGSCVCRIISHFGTIHRRSINTEVHVNCCSRWDYHLHVAKFHNQRLAICLLVVVTSPSHPSSPNILSAAIHEMGLASVLKKAWGRKCKSQMRRKTGAPAARSGFRKRSGGGGRPTWLRLPLGVVKSSPRGCHLICCFQKWPSADVDHWCLVIRLFRMTCLRWFSIIDAGNHKDVSGLGQNYYEILSS